MKNNNTTKQVVGMVVYFDAEKKCRQLIYPRLIRNTPSETLFDGNWAALAQQIAGNNGYHSFELI